MIARQQIAAQVDAQKPGAAGYEKSGWHGGHYLSGSRDNHEFAEIRINCQRVVGWNAVTAGHHSLIRRDPNMNEFHHAIVWIDHQQARVLRFGSRGVDTEIVHSSQRHEHLHHKANSIDSGKAPRDRAFLERVGESLSSTATILVTGPASAKRELLSHLQAHQKVTASHIVGVEPLDHPSDGQLEAFARKYFHADERMRVHDGISQ